MKKKARKRRIFIPVLLSVLIILFVIDVVMIFSLRKQPEMPEQLDVPQASSTTEALTEPAPAATEPVVNEALRAYGEILAGHRAFLDYYTAWSMSLDSDYHFISDKMVDEIQAYSFALVDLDSDGTEELILKERYGGDLYAGFKVLRYSDGGVGGYSLSYRNFDQLKTDGSHVVADSAWDFGIGTMRFEDNSIFVDRSVNSETVTLDDGSSKDNYFVNGQPATKDEFDALFAQHAEKTDVTWYDLTEENLILAGLAGEGFDYPISAVSQIAPKVLKAFTDVLAENGTFYDCGTQQTTTLSAYCQEAEERIGGPVKLPFAAAVDMDGDGTKEVILQIVPRENPGNLLALWVFHYERGMVQGQLFYNKQMSVIAADGTFWESGEGNKGAARLVFGDEPWYIEDVPDEEFDNKESVRWAAYPCSDIERIMTSAQRELASISVQSPEYQLYQAYAASENPGQRSYLDVDEDGIDEMFMEGPFYSDIVTIRDGEAISLLPEELHSDEIFLCTDNVIAAYGEGSGGHTIRFFRVENQQLQALDTLVYISPYDAWYRSPDHSARSDSLVPLTVEEWKEAAWKYTPRDPEAQWYMDTFLNWDQAS